MSEGASSQGPRRSARELRERIVWRAMVVMLLAVTGWLFYVAFDARQQVEELEARLEEQQDCECE